MKIVREEVIKINMTEYLFLVKSDYSEVKKPGDTAHYLFVYLTLNNNNLKIGEIGCRWGSSTRIFGLNPTNIVDGYDISLEHLNQCHSFPHTNNVNFFNLDLTQDENIHKLLDYDLLFIDIGDHIGIVENKIYQYLLTHAYKGVTIWDDIYPPWKMSEWWNSLPDKNRYDVSEFTNNWGLGIIDFSGKLVVE